MSDRPASRAIHAQALRFAALSVLSFAGYLGLTAFLHEFVGVSSYVAVPIAMACITLLNFYTLRLFIFDNAGRQWLTQLAGFLASIAGFRVAEYGCFLLLHGLLGFVYLYAYAVILFASAICKFIFLRSVLFAPVRPATPFVEPTP